MKSMLVRSLPLVNLAINLTYLLHLYLIVQKELDDRSGSFDGFLRNGERWRKYEVKRPPGESGRERNEKTPTSTADGSVMDELLYILDWTSFYELPMSDEYLMRECPELPCRLTTDRRLLHRSAAVVFHPPDTRVLDWPLWRSPYQSYVMTLWESPTSVLDVGWSNLRKYAGLFNLTMTYRYDSDIPAPYGHLAELPARRNKEFDKELRRSIEKKTKLVAWFVSHCSTRSQREKFVEELQRYVPVDVYGYCGTLQCEKSSCDELRVLGQYKFYLSFENSICKDYITEKFYERLSQDVVPLVLGGAGNFVQENDAQYPRNGFIVATNFSSMKHLAEYLLYLDKHPEEYAKYFEWRRRYEAVMSWPRLFERAYCGLCRRLLWIKDDYERRRQSYADMYHWWHEKYECDDGLVRRFLEKIG